MTTEREREFEKWWQRTGFFVAPELMARRAFDDGWDAAERNRRIHADPVYRPTCFDVVLPERDSNASRDSELRELAERWERSAKFLRDKFESSAPCAYESCALMLRQILDRKSDGAGEVTGSTVRATVLPTGDLEIGGRVVLSTPTAKPTPNPSAEAVPFGYVVHAPNGVTFEPHHKVVPLDSDDFSGARKRTAVYTSPVVPDAEDVLYRYLDLCPDDEWLDGKPSGEAKALRVDAMRRAIAASLAAAPTPEPLSESPWRDISTAPRDGTSVLLKVGGDIHSRPAYVSGSYYGTDDNGNTTWTSDYSCTEYLHNPTHWTPLLPGPTMENSK